MAAEQHPERRKPWQEKNVVVAGVLAFLIPGAGHFYQGRMFKAVLYFVCILGTSFGGMKLGEGAVIYYEGPTRGLGSKLAYFAQACVGLTAMPALVQSKRANEPSNRPVYELTHPLRTSFTGRLVTTGGAKDVVVGELTGVVDLQTTANGVVPETTGTLRGTLDGQPVEYELAGGFLLDRPIGAGFQRRMECSLARQPDQHPHETQSIRGTIPRRFQDAYCAPPDADTIQDLHGRLGKVYDLAVAFTMIAGLLNVLAIWDAIEGPAYGFGDEPSPGETPKPGDPTPASGGKSAT